ncbi:haloacid dehalogenase [Diaporthe helianthi]|uniref:Haloacid dehalogenase n=1 Tax=Diaporthe helianthi TaxID=158607 RepID=A0A2P5I0J8_DIAHE|nr:haloacid dehalogenase [Diaporthe helianthi]
MPATKSKIVIAFDLYGTILSTDSITKDLATHLSINKSKAQAVATKWRQYQLEYTWRVTAMATYKPFDKITRAALRHAAAEVLDGVVDVSDKAVERLMAAYDALAVFPDVPAGLRAIQNQQGGGPAVEAVVFSNGTEKMLSTSVGTSPDLKPFVSSGGGGGLFRKLVTVDEVRTYKPTAQSYSHLQAEADEDNDAVLWLVSANPFDVAGARSVGLRSAWIDRAGTGWVDRLGEAIFGVGDDVRKRRARPTIIAEGVDQAVEEILRIGI